MLFAVNVLVVTVEYTFKVDAFNIEKSPSYDIFKVDAFKVDAFKVDTVMLEASIEEI